MKFTLLARDGEYRLGRMTKTETANNFRHGWNVVKTWRDQPTNQAVVTEATAHKISQEA